MSSKPTSTRERSDGMPAGGEEHGDVVDDVADALTLNREVQWERCEKLATPANRRALRNLRMLAPLVTAHEPAPETAAVAGAHARDRAFGHRASQALIAIAAVEVAAALMLLPWAWGDYRREHGEIAVYLATKLVGHSAGACLLLFAGRHDPRTWLLGIYCLLKATLPQMHMLPAFLLELPPPEQLSAYLLNLPGSSRLFLYLYVPSFVFAPVFLWLFARECPRVHFHARLDDLARRMVPASVAIGFAIWVGCGVTLQLAQAGYAEASVPVVLDGSVAVLDLLALAAAVVVALRAHTAQAEEVRRVVVFSVGFLMYTGLVAVYDLAEAFAPGNWATNYRRSPAVLAMEVMRFPGMVLLWYSVLAARVPHVREVVQAGCTRLLTRPGRLQAAAAAPALALAWVVASRPERTVGALLADPAVQSLFAVTGIVLLAALGREPILHRVAAWTHPEATDQKQALATATAALAQAGSIKRVSRAVTRAARRGCGSPAVLAAVIDPDTHAKTFHAPDDAPLPRSSAIIHMLESPGGALRVHPTDASSLYGLLPPDEAAWVVETAADAIVPVPGPGGELLGVLAVGRRFDDRLVRPTDVQAGEAPECGCGPAYDESQVPKLLAGKFRLTRRLGAGGMGAAYLARDVRLQRNVAVKILTRPSALGPLKSEAWAMAELAHPAVAQIYAVESWRGRPFLVAEYLAGGTLADQLRRGPVPEREAASIAVALADALADLHDAGYLHGDVKPSNIGFTATGSPKLLDFGLAREPNDAGVVGGTLRYASPEVISGRPAAEPDDVWSLAVVLYEMVSRDHPFARPGADAAEVAHRIRRRRVRTDGLRSGPARQSAMAAFAAAVLSAPRPVRPPTAHDFADALRAAVAADV